MIKAHSSVDEVPAAIIRPLRGWISIDFKELWAYRELIYTFASRDIRVRYKQTALGAAWAIIHGDIHYFFWRTCKDTI